MYLIIAWTQDREEFLLAGPQSFSALSFCQAFSQMRRAFYAALPQGKRDVLQGLLDTQSLQHIRKNARDKMKNKTRLLSKAVLFARSLVERLLASFRRTTEPVPE